MSELALAHSGGGIAGRSSASASSRAEALQAFHRGSSASSSAAAPNPRYEEELELVAPNAAVGAGMAGAGTVGAGAAGAGTVGAGTAAASHGEAATCWIVRRRIWSMWPM
mgnify:CR=1 FL=1